MLGYFSRGHITLIPHGYSPVYLGQTKVSLCTLVFSFYLSHCRYSQTSKMFQGICRATAHPQKQVHFSSK